MSKAADLATRRALLVTKAELDRIEVALAWHDLRRAVFPGQDGSATARATHPWIGRVLGFVVPLLGATRARRLSRYLSLALFAYRIVAGLSRGR
jgi:hypothetical protein